MYARSNPRQQRVRQNNEGKSRCETLSSRLIEEIKKKNELKDKLERLENKEKVKNALNENLKTLIKLEIVEVGKEIMKSGQNRTQMMHKKIRNVQDLAQMLKVD